MEKRVAALESVALLFMGQLDLECSQAEQTDAQALDTIRQIASFSSKFRSEYAVVRGSDGHLALSRDMGLRTVAAAPNGKGEKRKPANDDKWIPRMKPVDRPPPLEELPTKIPKKNERNGQQ